MPVTRHGGNLPDPHPQWLAEWRKVHADWIASKENTSEDKRLGGEYIRMSDLIRTTPAKTVQGVIAQLECLFEDFGYAMGEQELVTLRVVLTSLKGMV